MGFALSSPKLFEKRSVLPLAAEQVFDWHARPGALERLIPPIDDVRIVERKGTIRPGDSVVLDIKKGPLRFTVRAEHGEWEPGRSFTDRMTQGPFSEWRHLHEFSPMSDSMCEMIDRIYYRPGALLRWKPGGVEADLKKGFDWRHERVRRDLARQVGDTPLTIVVAGGSGLVGSALIPFLTTAGHSVKQLVRREPRDDTEIVWRPSDGKFEGDVLRGVDAVVHLGGAGIADKAWTDERKRVIRDSRVDSTRLLAKAIAATPQPRPAFICASAIGYYGTGSDKPIDETAPAGAGFLADVCREWEAATKAASEAGARVVNVRIGIVLTPRGGALAALLPIFRSFVGGPAGSGDQVMSWIGLDDLIGVLHHAIRNQDVRGPINATAPQPATNREFSETLGRVLSRPSFAPAPAFAIKTVMGDRAQLVLEGARVLPKKLQESGFEFQEPNLEGALKWELCEVD
ncbi:MAG: TIGR01777 family oxidoreductase [Phycisphaerales bacterium]|nr:TIGR01777 family oxidoreductase [Phycisphaerales bacterium]